MDEPTDIIEIIDFKPKKKINKPNTKRFDPNGRKCSYCEIFKPWTDFLKLKSGINGYRNKCKECKRNKTPKKNIYKINK